MFSVEVLLRRPDVKMLSVADAATAPGPGKPDGGNTEAGNPGPGKNPLGFAAEADAGPPNVGAVPPCTPIRPLLISVLPRNQSNPSARLSSCVTSANFASIVN